MFPVSYSLPGWIYGFYRMFVSFKEIVENHLILFVYRKKLK